MHLQGGALDMDVEMIDVFMPANLLSGEFRRVYHSGSRDASGNSGIIFARDWSCPTVYAVGMETCEVRSFFPP
jgi:hypothetical protein